MNKRTKETVKIFDDAAKRYQDKYMDVSAYSEHLSIFCDALPDGRPSVLDVACGPGNIAKYIMTNVPACRLTASDLSSEMLRLTQMNVPSAAIMTLDAKAIRSIKKKYDGLVASFIFPYLSTTEVIDFIQDASNILNEGGVMYISTMLGSNTDSGFDEASDGVRLYMNYHQGTDIEKTLKQFGFKILSSALQPYDYALDNKGTDVIIIAQLTA